MCRRKGKAVRLSYDHKASDKVEQHRVTENGGLIMWERVNGTRRFPLFLL